MQCVMTTWAESDMVTNFIDADWRTSSWVGSQTATEIAPTNPPAKGDPEVHEDAWYQPVSRASCKRKIWSKRVNAPH
jgi:hypothetical protein